MHSATVPVHEADNGVEDGKGNELFVEQFVDAPFPSEEQLGKAAEPSVGYFQGVRDRHDCVKRFCNVVSKQENIKRTWKATIENHQH